VGGKKNEKIQSAEEISFFLVMSWKMDDILDWFGYSADFLNRGIIFT